MSRRIIKITRFLHVFKEATWTGQWIHWTLVFSQQKVIACSSIYSTSQTCSKPSSPPATYAPFVQTFNFEFPWCRWCVFHITLFYHDFIMFIFLLSVVFHNVYRLFVYLGSRRYSTKAEKTPTLKEAMVEYIKMRHRKEFKQQKQSHK